MPHAYKVERGDALRKEGKRENSTVTSDELCYDLLRRG